MLKEENTTTGSVKFLEVIRHNTTEFHLNALLEVVDGGQHVLRERLAVERIGRRVEQVAQDDGAVHDLAAWQ